jgi:hypothetical protein
MGPLLMGSGGGESTFLRDEPEIVVDTLLRGRELDGVRVLDESRVDFLEMAAEFGILDSLEVT